jgi:hypothetical protein
VNGQTRTFKDGEGITLPRNQGGRQTIAGDIVFAGYALQIPDAKLNDYAAIDPKGKVLVWLGSQGPAELPQGSGRLLQARSRQAIEKGAVAVIAPTPPAGGAGRGGGGGRGNTAPTVDPNTAPHFTTVQRYDQPVAPSATAQDEFFEFLFSGSDVKYADLKAKAEKREALPTFAVKNAKITFNIDPDYTVVRLQLTKNVVGLVEGSDAKLKNTYVVYGAHYDHTGYREGPPRPGRGGQPPPDPNDRINNGADDDGSGTVAIMAIARAFAQGPKPKRSLLFVWHAGEEVGLLGSRYNADFPVVPLESMVAQINMDMVGRNRDNKPEESNTVYVIGSDRISTELHNINEDANASLPKPLTMDYEMNDPADPQSFYTRSDHYSYAAKGIPIVFFFTGTHPDYHAVSDTVDKIVFDKIQRIAQLAYETGRRVANLDHAPARDNKGPRAGKGSKGKIGGQVSTPNGQLPTSK